MSACRVPPTSMIRAIDVNCTSSVFKGKLIRSCDAILPPCRAIRYSRANVVPGVPTSNNIQFKYVRLSTPEYTNHTKKCKHILCCTLYTKSVQQYTDETFIVCPRYYARLQGKLESISKILGQICDFHCLRCVCYASYVRAKLISMGQKYFYYAWHFPLLVCPDRRDHQQ